MPSEAEAIVGPSFPLQLRSLPTALIAIIPYRGIKFTLHYSVKRWRARIAQSNPSLHYQMPNKIYNVDEAALAAETDISPRKIHIIMLLM